MNTQLRPESSTTGRLYVQLRVVPWGFSIAFVGIGILTLAKARAGSESLTGGIGTAFMLFAMAACLWRIGAYPSIKWDSTGIEVRNPLNTFRLPWEDVKGIAVRTTLLRRSGLFIRTLSDAEIDVWAARPTVPDFLGVRATGLAHTLFQAGASADSVTSPPETRLPGQEESRFGLRSRLRPIGAEKRVCTHCQSTPEVQRDEVVWRCQTCRKLNFALG